MVDAGLLEAELKRYMDKNGLSDESSSSTSDGLRIRLTLKKSNDSDTNSKKSKSKKKRKNEDRQVNEKSSKRSRFSIGKKSNAGSQESSQCSSDENDTNSTEHHTSERSIYADVVGMEQRVVENRKRGKARGGNRGSGGAGSRGGKGSYNKRKSVE